MTSTNPKPDETNINEEWPQIQTKESQEYLRTIKLKHGDKSLLEKAKIPDEFKDDVVGVYYADENSKDLFVVVKCSNQFAQFFIRTMALRYEGDCLYMIFNLEDEKECTFDTSDFLLRKKMTAEATKQLINEVRLNLNSYSRRGLVISQTVANASIFTIRRKLLEELECTKNLMPTEEEMISQYKKRQEGGGETVAIPLQFWNTQMSKV